MNPLYPWFWHLCLCCYQILYKWDIVAIFGVLHIRQVFRIQKFCFLMVLPQVIPGLQIKDDLKCLGKRCLRAK